jgi:hypothetical protein
MLVSTPNRFRHTLEKLAAEPPNTKTALIQSLLFEIEAALASGKTWKQVWQCLADDGLDISYQTFRKVLQRVRKKRCRKCVATSWHRTAMTFKASIRFESS